MDIDDEYEQFMRLTHADLDTASPQYAIMRTAFFAGMMAMFPIFHLEPKSRAVGALVDVRKQLATHVQRANDGMEPGFTNTKF